MCASFLWHNYRSAHNSQPYTFPTRAEKDNFAYILFLMSSGLWHLFLFLCLSSLPQLFHMTHVTFSILNFSSACVAKSTASCCMSSFISAFLITAFRSDIFPVITVTVLLAELLGLLLLFWLRCSELFPRFGDDCCWSFDGDLCARDGDDLPELFTHKISQKKFKRKTIISGYGFVKNSNRK